MKRFLSRPGIPPAVAGLTILFQAVLARIVLLADETRVYALGHPLQWACSFHQRFGLPCPTCGLTRSLVLTLHGQLARAWRVAPGGPALTLGVLFVAVGLLILAAVEFRSAERPFDKRRTERTIRKGLEGGTLAWAGISTMVWLAGWVIQFSFALRAMH